MRALIIVDVQNDFCEGGSLAVTGGAALARAISDYRNPGNVFVAGFIGSPAMNLFRLSIADSTVSLGDWQILLPRADARRRRRSAGVPVWDIAARDYPARAGRGRPLERRLTGPIDFDITAEQREALYQRGFQAGQKFLANWNYADYLADCGGPFTPSL